MQIQPVEKQEVCCCNTGKHCLFTQVLWGSLVLCSCWVFLCLQSFSVSVYLFNYKVSSEAKVDLHMVPSPKSN